MAMQGPDGTVGGPEVPQPADALTELFTYHPPTEDQKQAYGRIRSKAMALASEILDSCPSGPDRTAAIRKVREAVMTANASIATNNAAVRVR